MRAVLAILIGLSLACPAVAYDGPPPKRFVHAYKRGKLIWESHPIEKMNDVCENLFDDFNWRWNRKEFRQKQVYGCAVPHLDPRGTKFSWCRIIFDGSWEIFIHELAHCNGWTEKHEK